MNKQQDKNLIEGHEYDGIQELNNPLSNWWVVVLFLTIVFAVGYYAYYELGSGPSSDQELAADMGTINKNKEKSTASSGGALDISSVDYKAILADASKLQQGQAVFAGKCIACHAVDGGGGIGPNLVDEYWLHGGRFKDIYTVISNGVLSKGMPSWKDLVKQDERLFVAAYILSIKGHNVAQAKAPQGEKFKQ